jgi:hypothetical protein
MDRKVLEVRYDVTGLPSWEAEALASEAAMVSEASSDYTEHETHEEAIHAALDTSSGVGHRSVEVEVAVIDYPDEDDAPAHGDLVARARARASRAGASADFEEFAEDLEPDGYTAELLAGFEEKLPGAEIAIVDTGGGCEWLTISFPGERSYYAATDGQAGIPGPDEGWGYLGFFADADDEGTTIGSWEEATGSSVVEAIMEHRSVECPCGAGPFSDWAAVEAHAREWHPDRMPRGAQFTVAQADTVARLVREQLHPRLGLLSEDGELTRLEICPVEDSGKVEVVASALYAGETDVRAFVVTVDEDGSDGGWTETN